jgi:hypothetical protein
MILDLIVKEVIVRAITINPTRVTIMDPINDLDFRPAWQKERAAERQRLKWESQPLYVHALHWFLELGALGLRLCRVRDMGRILRTTERIYPPRPCLTLPVMTPELAYIELFYSSFLLLAPTVMTTSAMERYHQSGRTPQASDVFEALWKRHETCQQTIKDARSWLLMFKLISLCMDQFNGCESCAPDPAEALWKLALILDAADHARSLLPSPFVGFLGLAMHLKLEKYLEGSSDALRSEIRPIVTREIACCFFWLLGALERPVDQSQRRQWQRGWPEYLTDAAGAAGRLMLLGGTLGLAFRLVDRPEDRDFPTSKTQLLWLEALTHGLCCWIIQSMLSYHVQPSAQPTATRQHALVPTHGLSHS